MCSSGFTNLDAYYELKYCLDKNDVSIDTVIFAQSIMNFIVYDDELYNMKSTIIYSEQLALLDYKQFFNTYRSCPNYYKTQIGSVRWIKSLLDSPYSKGFSPIFKNKMSNANYHDVEGIIARTGGRDGLTSGFIREHYSLQVKWLKAISDLCEENEIVLTVWCPPLYHIPEIISSDGFYSILSEVLPPETLIADYTSYPLPDSSYFADPRHLGYKGAQFLSSEVAEKGLAYVPLSSYNLE